MKMSPIQRKKLNPVEEEESELEDSGSREDLPQMPTPPQRKAEPKNPGYESTIAEMSSRMNLFVLLQSEEQFRRHVITTMANIEEKLEELDSLVKENIEPAD